MVIGIQVEFALKSLPRCYAPSFEHDVTEHFTLISGPLPQLHGGFLLLLHYVVEALRSPQGWVGRLAGGEKMKEREK